MRKRFKRDQAIRLWGHTFHPWAVNHLVQQHEKQNNTISKKDIDQLLREASQQIMIRKAQSNSELPLPSRGAKGGASCFYEIAYPEDVCLLDRGFFSTSVSRGAGGSDCTTPTLFLILMAAF